MIDSHLGEFIDELSIILNLFTGKELQSVYYLHHNKKSNNNQNYSVNCKEVLDCAGFIKEEAGVQSKNFTGFVKSILIDHNLIIELTTGFGYLPVVGSLSNHLLDGVSLFHSSIEGGGGSGFGFQMYCNDVMIMNAGMGGGGGLKYKFQRDMDDSRCLLTELTYGGGGGGGIQFNSKFGSTGDWNNVDLLNATFVSVGGGSGCGTCEEGSKKSCSNQLGNCLSCGEQIDSDSLSNVQLEELLITQFNAESFQKCRRIDVFGGGGGGGGTVQYCLPFQIGYGFSFHIYSTGVGDDDDHVIGSTDETNGEIQHVDPSDDNPSEEDSSGKDNESKRYQYDLVGKWIHLATTRCQSSSSDSIKSVNVSTDPWCCVCSVLQTQIIQCLSNTTTVWNNILDMSCIDLQSYPLNSFNWLATQPSCEKRLPSQMINLSSIITRCCDAVEDDYLRPLPNPLNPNPVPFNLTVDEVSPFSLLSSSHQVESVLMISFPISCFWVISILILVRICHHHKEAPSWLTK